MKNDEDILNDIRTLQEQAGNSALLHNARKRIQEGRLDEAGALTNKVLQNNPEYSDAIYLKGVIAWERRQYDLASKYIRRAIKIKPNQPEYQLSLALALDINGQLDEALAACDQAINLNCNQAEAYNIRGDILGQMGNLEESIENHLHALELNPELPEAYRSLVFKQKTVPDDPIVKIMEQLYCRYGDNSEARMHLGFALGKAQRDIGSYSKASKYYQEANRIKRSTYHYNLDYDKQKASLVCNLFCSELFSRYMGSGESSTSPIFVIGMLRSGTTLVEQILATHPYVAGAGELPYIGQLAINEDDEQKHTGLAWLTDLSPAVLRKKGNEYLVKARMRTGASTEHFTDKMPLNFWFVGFIRLILPNAKIIHVQRDAKDTCLSIYTHLFNGYHPYAYDLKELGGYYKIYLLLMEHWNKLFPGHIYNLTYEKLVDSPAKEIRRLLDYCELPFEKQCLSFNETKRNVQTTSAQQVRRPIYKDSLCNWINFEHMLQPLLSELSNTHTK